MPHRNLDRLLVTLDVAVEAVAICEVRRGYRLVGKLSNSIEVHYVLSGTMFLMVPGVPAVICGPGSIVIVPPNSPQTICADETSTIDMSSDEVCKMTRDGLLLFDAAQDGVGDLRIVCGLIMASFSGSFGLLDQIKAPLVADMSDLEIVRRAFAIMLHEISIPRLGTRALTGALMKTCLVMLLRRYLEGNQPSSVFLADARDPRLGKAVVAVLDKPAAVHTVASLASIAGMSRSVFARNFQDSFAMSPIEFVAKTRLHHAAEMLRSSDVSIKVIAASIGFGSRSHFSRAFRAAYGTDPRNFRRIVSRDRDRCASTTARITRRFCPRPRTGVIMMPDEPRPMAADFTAETLPYPARQSDMSQQPDSDLSNYRPAGKLTDKVALITGADSGIGRAVAIAFAMEGAKVAILFNENDGDAAETKRMVEAKGGACLVLKHDVRSSDQCRAAVAATLQAFGGLNILVNNAAFQKAEQRFEDFTEEDWRRTFETNIYGYFFMAQAAVPHLAANDAIINTGSIVGMTGLAILLPYTVTKGAIHAFTKSLALSLGDRGIRVNCVVPGPVWTPNIPGTMPADEIVNFGHEVALGRPGQPEELAPAYVLLASSDGSFMTGALVEVTGGRLSAA